MVEETAAAAMADQAVELEHRPALEEAALHPAQPLPGPATKRKLAGDVAPGSNPFTRRAKPTLDA